jgi:glutathione S-transferase
MIKLYGQLRSRASRSLWALEEIGVPYELVPIDTNKGDNDKPEFLAINPNGRIPALVDGDLTLFESMAINLYLARKYGKDLWPANEAGEAHTLQWSFWGMTEVEPFLITLLVQQVFTPEDQRRPDRVEEARQALVPRLGVLNNHLSGRPFLLGSKFTIADLNLSSVFSLAEVVKVELAPYPNIKKWVETCFSRPARQKLSAA